MSFTLVDRITAFVPGRSARGSLEVPAAEDPLAPCFLVEAIGQLIGWVAMEATAFQYRPVAAIAGELRVLADAPSRAAIEIEAEITSRKSLTVGYRGRASAGTQTLIEIERAAVALLSIEEFDDPSRVRDELATLRGPGLGARRFPALAELRPKPAILERGDDRLVAEIDAPRTSSLYADHFPRRAVYPATLLLDAQIELAKALLASRGDAAPRLVRVSKVKVRSFTPPGGRITVEARVATREGARVDVVLAARAGEERVSNAEAEFALAPGNGDEATS